LTLATVVINYGVHPLTMLATVSWLVATLDQLKAMLGCTWL